MSEDPTGRPADAPGVPARHAAPARSRGAVHRALHANRMVSLATKLTVGVVGSLVVAVGVVMLVTPGPAVVVIPLGLAILATEFAFARRWLERARDWAMRSRDRARALDPKVRRRRVLVAWASFVVVAGAVTVYLLVFDWPVWTVDRWDQVQSLAGWVPDLPGM